MYTIQLAATLAFFPALMAYSAFSDLLTMTIPNLVSLALVLGFCALAGCVGLGWHSVLVDHLSCAACVLALTFALFAFGWIGGGDAKLAAATSLWVGWEHVADYGVVASMLGGLLTLGILAARRQPLPGALAGQAWIARLRTPGGGVPYGIALAAAGLLLYPDTSIFAATASA